jgi:Uri superfamily endonuclease
LKLVGVYLLLFKLHDKACLSVAGRNACLEPSLYVYVGSACGPGGLRARLRRHLCGRRGSLHWHIDRILSLPGAEPLYAVYIAGERLCKPRAEPWLALASASARAMEPVGERIGSTDDKIAPTHLLRCKSNSIQSCMKMLIGIASSLPGIPELLNRENTC